MSLSEYDLDSNISKCPQGQERASRLDYRTLAMQRESCKAAVVTLFVWFNVGKSATEHHIWIKYVNVQNELKF